MSLWSNTKTSLLYCMACIVHHADVLIRVIDAVDANGGHPFVSIPILTHPLLLTELKNGHNGYIWTNQNAHWNSTPCGSYD